MAQEARYKLVKQIKDNSFDIDKLHYYCLSIQIGIKDFQLCVIDVKMNLCLLLEDYLLQEVKTINTRLTILRKLFDHHHLLTAGFWHSIKVSLKSHKFTLIPPSHFDENSIREYLSLNCMINDKVEEVYFYRHTESSAVNVFAADKRLVKWIRSLYSDKKVIVLHQGSALIEGILKQDKQIAGKVIYVILDRGLMHVLVSENGELYYYNQFAIKNPTDIKYIMLVMKEFGMNQRTQKVVLWGNITQKSEYFKLFTKYIGNLKFGTRPSHIKFNYYFDELADQQYFDLLSIYFCN